MTILKLLSRRGEGQGGVEDGLRHGARHQGPGGLQRRSLHASPSIFKAGLKVNTEVYLKVMEKTVLPWIKEVSGERLWVWQQDSAPRRSMLWLQNHCYNLVTPNVWPPNSPDLNPMDYFV